MDALLDDLNEPQRQAVSHTDGPLLILAGPGSGKTRVITRRVAYLARQGVAPWNILAITFTNKAAEEMRNRVAALTGGHGYQLYTFHAFGARLLREFAEPAGFDPRFVIYDVSDRRAVLKKVLEDLDVHHERLTPARLEELIGHQKDRLIGPAAYAAAAEGALDRTVAKIWQRYEELMRANNALDFDDLLFHTARLLQSSEEIRRYLAGRFRYVMVDEYQDTNHAQYQIARLLSRDHPGQPNLCVTGDPDQSIYAWRGADISNILSFEEDHPGATVIKLEENYRSTPQVLRLAEEVIAGNRRRKPKRLFTSNPAGPAVEFFSAQDEHAEAAHVARLIAAYLAEGGRADDVAVFYRINALSRPLEEAFRRAALPYRIARGVEFYSRKEIKDVLGYLRLLANPADSVALLRIINVPARKIGATTLERLDDAAAGARLSLYEAIREIDRFSTLKSGAGKLKSFGKLMEDLREQTGFPLSRDPRAARSPDAPPAPALSDNAPTSRVPSDGGPSASAVPVPGSPPVPETEPPAPALPVAEIIRTVLRLTGLEEELRLTDPERLENVEELVNSAAEFDQARQDDGQPGLLADWLNQVALVSDADRYEGATGAITFMTLHTAKGLEFPVVFLVGLEDGLIPHQRALEEGGPAAIEEERRLLFVGLTRAKRRLVLSHADRRMRQGFWMPSMPSQFVIGLRHDLFEWRKAPPLAPPADGGSNRPFPVRSTFTHTPDWAKRLLPPRK